MFLAAQPRPSPSTALKPRAFLIGLFLIALLTAIPRLLLGAHQFIEYDGYWHIFIAQQNTWSRFWEDVYANAHPPLYFLLLKAVLLFGHSLLVYRSISLISGIVSVAVVGWIARKVTGSEARAYQSAIVYGLSLSAIVIACEVRSYMLSMLFVLLSFSALLEIPQAASRRAETRARIGFVIWAILACLSEYFAFFYCGAALLVLFTWRLATNYRPATNSYRAATVMERVQTWSIELLTATPILATIAVLYFTHAGKLAQIQGHLLPYYFDPQGSETRLEFLIRNSRNFLNLFLPFQMPTAAFATVAVALLAMAACAVAAFYAGRNGRWTIATSALMLGTIALAAVAGKYPFGGDLRQQFLLFPFLVLCLAIVVEWIVLRAARIFPPGLRLAANGAVAVIAAAVCLTEFVHYPKTGVNVLAPEMAAFDRLEQKPAAVYLDQFNLITFFIYHHDWKWMAEPNQPLEGIDIYRLTKDGNQMLVFRDKNRWNIDPAEAPIFEDFARCLRLKKTPELSIFSVLQAQVKTPFSNVRGVQAQIIDAAANSHFCVERMALTKTTWYVTFRDSGCAPVPLPDEGSFAKSSGTTDDTDAAIEYVGAWAHATFHEARKGTLSYSNDAGAVARAPFIGAEITWVYTKAPNRGVAEVRIDEVSRGKIDLYSPSIVWQSANTFRALGPGSHTIEIIVSGDKSPQAADRFVDVDALIAK